MFAEVSDRHEDFTIQQLVVTVVMESEFYQAATAWLGAVSAL